MGETGVYVGELGVYIGEPSMQVGAGGDGNEDLDTGDEGWY